MNRSMHVLHPTLGFRVPKSEAPWPHSLTPLLLMRNGSRSTTREGFIPVTGFGNMRPSGAFPVSEDSDRPIHAIYSGGRMLRNKSFRPEGMNTERSILKRTLKLWPDIRFMTGKTVTPRLPQRDWSPEPGRASTRSSGFGSWVLTERNKQDK